MGFLDKAMNRYYYGKSGKGDFTESDLPATRMQLFWEMLRVRLSGLVRLNLIYVVVWLPAMLLLLMTAVGLLSTLAAEETEIAVMGGTIRGTVFTTLLLLVPCIAITGPCTAGVSYVTRNWARDEHAFVWSDFKDAVKANWKQSLVISTITGFIPLMVYLGWNFYGGLAAGSLIMIVPQILILFIGLLWSLTVTYMHPLAVTYQLTLRNLFRNAFLLGVAKLPMSAAIRLLHCVPLLLAVGIMFLAPAMYVILGLFLYYVLIGFSLSRFITASWTNAAFDKYINSRMEGVAVNRGLRTPEDDDDEDADADADGGDAGAEGGAE